jgi:hypothetical protein
MVQIIKDFAGLAVDLNGVQRTFDLPDMIKWLAAHGKDFINNTSNVDPEKVRSMGQFIKNLAESAILANGVTDTSLTSVQQLLDSFGKLTIPDFNSSGSENALGYISGLVTGLQNGVSAIKQESAVLSLKGHFAVNDTYKVWYQSGQYLARGLSKGISSMTSVVRSAALGVASGAVSAIRTAWDENSPSRVGTDLGMFFDLGIAGGFKAYSKVVNQNAADMGQGAVNSAQSALNLLKTNVEGIDATPTIRPIIDMTDVNNGVNTINGLFNANRTIRAGMFSGGAIGSNAFNRTYDRTQVVNATSNNRDVVQAINSLSNKFNNLSNAVSDMRVYIDSNTLVGRITPMVNRALGRVQARNNRGNNS